MPQRGAPRRRTPVAAAPSSVIVTSTVERIRVWLGVVSAGPPTPVLGSWVGVVPAARWAAGARATGAPAGAALVLRGATIVLGTAAVSVRVMFGVVGTP